MEKELNAIPMIPLRGMVVFPSTKVNLDIGRERSIHAVEAAMEGDRRLVVFTQRDEDVEKPTINDVYEIGTLIKISKTLRLPGGITRIFVEGISRVRFKGLRMEDPYFLVDTEIIEETVYEEEEDKIRLEGLARALASAFREWVTVSKAAPTDTVGKLEGYNEYHQFADFIASNLDINTAGLQGLLEELDLEKCMEEILHILTCDTQVIQIEEALNNKVRNQMEKSQREYFLREKLKAIHDELGDKVDLEEEVEELKGKLRSLSLDKSVHDRIEKEINRYDRMPPMMPESNILRNYLDWVLDLPWNKETADELNIGKAEKILNEDHYGLEKVKQRILEFLAVRQLTNQQSGSILCLVGPPGVGKTSLATSIARAMNKKFIRASLGGVRDEAEIRGHRRTYIGALPGRMIQGLKHAGTKNPVFLLDEIDKLGNDYKGDPSSALLEVLDPEQNSTFSDHFIEIPFDFSKVFWITTANVASNIPAPLLDRMEIINLSSYTSEEKVEIAKRYLVPKQLKKTGLPTTIKLTDAVIRKVIDEYTRESGVRTLEKTIGKVFRKLAYNLVHDANASLKVTVKNLHEYLGAPIYLPEPKERKNQVGLVCGLAWTSVGGVTLPCEATVMKGTGKLILTGSLGAVMKESAQAALSFVRHNSDKYKLPTDFHTKCDIHVHLPEGATPKDGPSAGITMTLAIISALTNQKVRNDIAMTGEVTLRGNVLPIGGLKEKLLAALRHGIKEVLIPEANSKDLSELPQCVKDGLTITLVKTMDEVLQRALVK